MNKIYTTLFILLLSSALKAQSFSVSGQVLSPDKEPIFYALVNIKGTNIYTTANTNGEFKLIVPKGSFTLSISMMGYVTLEQELVVTKPLTNLVYTLAESSLKIEGVVVTAKASTSRQGSSTYSIGSDAIKQVQAVSLTDILSLLPGGKFTPQKLTSVSQIDLRTAESSAVNSFGTAVILDGTPLSNDGNLQVENPSASLSTATNVANKGVDMREIPASNIESVEVITGVPSAKYGNITSGAVLVTRKAGYSALNVNFNTTPESYQGSVSRGFKLKHLGYLNTDADYAYSISRPTELKTFYQRVNLSARWTTSLIKKMNWNNTLALTYSFTGDGQRVEPEEVLVSNRDVKNHRFLLSSNGTIDFLGKLSYTFSANGTSQYTKLEQEANDGPRPLVEPLESGTYFTTFSPLVYMQTIIMKGLPLNIYGRIEANQHIEKARHNFSFSTGVEYSLDKNYGKGRIVGSESVGASGVPGSRGALFNNIPASKTFSAYHQLNVSREFKNFMYQLRAGIRYDNMIERFNLFSPRISTTIGFFNQFKLNGSWGLSYKAPSMITLYPGPVYFDIVNLSYYDPKPEERLAVVTSYVLKPNNTSLKPGKGETREVSLEWSKMGYTCKVTAYQKIQTRGISAISQLVVLENQHYNIIEEPVGKPPVVEPDPGNILYMPRTYSAYGNNDHSNSRGIELDFSTPRIKATNTSFNIKGRWINTESLNDVPSIRFSNTSVSKSRYGVYSSVARQNQVCNANLTAIQQIAELRMMITFTSEFNFYSKISQRNPSLLPVGYYESQGNYVEIPEQDRNNPEYADLVLSTNQFTPTILPFYPNFHLQIRKETRQGHSFSFYANNCFWYNPYIYDSYSSLKSRVNSRISFGFGIGIKL